MASAAAAAASPSAESTSTTTSAKANAALGEDGGAVAAESPNQPDGARHAAGPGLRGQSSSSPDKHKPPHAGEEEGAATRRASTATATTAAFEDATARAPLTPLGRVLSALPVDPSVGKMLALGALFGESEHVLTLAAALTTQTPFDARASASTSGANPVAEFASPNGERRLVFGWGRTDGLGPWLPAAVVSGVGVFLGCLAGLWVARLCLPTGPNCL